MCASLAALLEIDLIMFKICFTKDEVFLFVWKKPLLHGRITSLNHSGKRLLFLVILMNQMRSNVIIVIRIRKYE